MERLQVFTARKAYTELRYHLNSPAELFRHEIRGKLGNGPDGRAGKLLVAGEGVGSETFRPRPPVV